MALTIHRMFRNKRDTVLFLVLVDREKQKIRLAKWVPGDDPATWLAHYSFVHGEPLGVDDRLGIGAKGVQALTLASGVARYLANHPSVTTAKEAEKFVTTETAEEAAVRRKAEKHQDRARGI